MKLRLHFLTILLFTFFTSFSQLQTINTVGFTFSPDTVSIYLGDTVEFGPLGYHNAVEVDESTWIANDTTPNGGFYFAFGGPGGYFIADSAKTYYYVCQPHASMGMKGVIIVNPVATYGCTDSNATNFDPLAAIDDGSCLYDSACITFSLFDVLGHLLIESTGCMPNNINSGLAQLDTTGIAGTGNLQVNWWDASGTTLLGDSLSLSALDTGTYIIVIQDDGCPGLLTDTFNIGYNYGCMDSLATNYNPLATCDDGCTYPAPPAENLFFSEYGEGSGNNKYFEVYNPTADTVDLTNYAFARVSNSPGNGPGVYEYWVDFDSGAVILPYDVYVVVHPSADAFIIAQADMDYGSLSNGDDGFALVYGTQPSSPVGPAAGGYIILDWIGDWNGDPGSGWEVAGVNNATQNNTLIRKCPISQGDTSWTNAAGTNAANSQWIVKPNEYWNDLGSHNWQTISYDSVSYTICSGLSVTIGNHTYDSSGIYFDTLVGSSGCDSVVTTSLTVLSSSASVIVNDITICDGDSVVVGSNIYDNTGTYVDTFLNSAGCDSIITTNLTVQTPNYQDITICDGDSIVVGSSVYNTAGSYTDTITSSFGCDSIVHTNLTIYSQFNSMFGGIPNNTVGGGGFYSGSQHLEMICYIPSELVSAVVYAADTVVETFEIRDNNGNVLDDTLVTVIPGGHRIYFNYMMSAGFDYELGVNGNSNDLFRSNSGVNYPYDFGSMASVTSSSAGGNYYYFFYDIEVRQSSQPTNYSICDGESITVAGSVYSTTGLYTDSLTSSIGCDSLVFTNLMVHPNVTYTNNQTICSGEVYVIGNNTYDSTGVYIDSLNTSYGCDSIVTTNLTVLTITGATGVNPQTICLGDSASVGTSTYYNAGVYLDTLVSSNGCDSVVTTTITVLTANYATYITGLPDTSAAPGAFSNYDGYLNVDAIVPSLIKSATVYAEDTNTITFELRDNNGFILDDVTHTVYPGAQSLIFNFMVPVGNDFQLGVDGSSGNIGLFRSNAGNGNSLPYPFDIGALTITSANNNLSNQYYYYYYDIEIMPYAHYEDIFICEGDSIVIAGNIYDSPTTIIETFTSSNSCDSVVHTVLDYYQTPSLFIQSVPDPPEICLGDSVILEGSDGFVDYWWTDENGNIILIDNRLVDNPIVDTWYMLLAKDSNGCISREDIWVYVDSCISGLNEELLSNMNIYPNPSSGLFTVEFKRVTENNSNISIVNSIGNVVFSEKLIIGEFSKQIDLSNFSKGIYLIEVQTERGVYKKKIILQ